MIKKRFFTLLEVLIAFSLAVLIFVSLFGFYSYFESSYRSFEKLREEFFRKRYFQMRMTEVFTSVYSFAQAKHNKKLIYAFYTEEESHPLVKEGSLSLVLTFDNGVTIDPLFSNQVLAKIFINHHNELVLVYWPSPTRVEGEKAPVFVEKLLLDVENISFSFFDPSSEEQHWKTYWDKEEKKLPPMIKIDVLSKGKTKKYAFLLPKSSFIIKVEK